MRTSRAAGSGVVRQSHIVKPFDESRLKSASTLFPTTPSISFPTFLFRPPRSYSTLCIFTPCPTTCPFQVYYSTYGNPRFALLNGIKHGGQDGLISTLPRIRRRLRHTYQSQDPSGTDSSSVVLYPTSKIRLTVGIRLTILFYTCTILSKCRSRIWGLFAELEAWGRDRWSMRGSFSIWFLAVMSPRETRLIMSVVSLLSLVGLSGSHVPRTKAWGVSYGRAVSPNRVGFVLVFFIGGIRRGKAWLESRRY